MSSSTSPTSKTASSSSSQSYINKFGYHFAKKLLGGGALHNDDDGPFFYPQSTTTNTTTNEPSTNKCLVFYRANWRSNIHQFPWNLSSEDGKHDTNDCTSSTLSSSEAESTSMSLQRVIEAETMFIDVTFDFACVHSSSNDGSNEDKDKVRVVSTAVRIGAVVALPTNNNDGYHCYYLRGKPLTTHDIYEHCRTMDIDPENTPVEILAEMLAHSFQMSTLLSSTWRIVGQCDVEAKDQYHWEMTIGHSGELEGEVSTLCFCTGTWHECLGDVLSSRVLDVIFLQWRRTRGENNDSGDEGDHCFVRLSQEEGRSFWSDLTNDGDWMEVITSGDEEPRVSVEDATPSSSSKETARVQIAQENHTKQSEEPPPSMDNGNTNVKKTERLSSSGSHGNKMLMRPSKPSETVMYAHGKRTCIAGSKKKKKAKFTLGSI